MTEQLLLAAAQEAGVEFVWETPVAGVEPRGDGVTVVTETGGRLEAEFVIGADGARSNVRTSLEIPLEGPRTENAFVIVDAAEDPDAPLPVERIFHYEHPAVGRSQRAVRAVRRALAGRPPVPPRRRRGCLQRRATAWRAGCRS